MNKLIDQDKDHRTLALDGSQSFIVQAPAGSGKTEILIQRFLVLLNQVKKPEEILAITFTKKAANEMRSRIINALKQAQMEEPTSPHAKKTWYLAKKILERDKKLNWHILNNPNQLSIQTIDSLCAYLTKQLPLLSHFGSQPDIAVYPAALYREAVGEVLSHLEENVEWAPAIAALLLHVDNDLNKLHELLITLLAKRDQWLPYLQLHAHPAAIKKQLEHHLALVIADILEQTISLFSTAIINQLIPLLHFSANNLALSQSHSALTACQDILTLPLACSDKLSCWQGIAQLLLTKKFTWRKKVDESIGFPPLNSLKNPQEKIIHKEHRQQFAELIEALEEHEDLRLALAHLLTLPDAAYPEKQWPILLSLLQILKVAVSQLRLTFQQHGQIDFIENTQAAIAALGDDESPTNLALLLDYQIQHILVDEFQDTSYIQYQLLEKLISGWQAGDGKTLFVVGDPMQSIYRFRQAEVGLFMRMRREGIGHIALIPLTLSVNFRSTANIVEWSNAHFHAIFPAFNHIATGAVSFSPSVSTGVHHEKTSSIEIKSFTYDTGEMQAQSICTLIKDVKKQFPEDSTAILVRARTHLIYIIPALKKAHIPYRAVEIDSLASKQCIQDLLSLTCALLHPADRISWLAVLRAPWCGLTLTDLLPIANHAYTTIWAQLNHDDIKKKLSIEGQTRLNKILPILKLKMHERQRMNLSTWIESTWLLLGGPACLDNETDLADAQAFFSLLENIEQNNPVLDLNKLKERIKQLYAAAEHDDSAVQIMTIHTAKGLEFDTVILPHLEKKIPGDDKSLLTWLERPLKNDKMALLLAPLHQTGEEKDMLYEYIHSQHKIKSDYETERLFYVAATRAKQRLYLSFNVNETIDDHDIRIEGGSFLEKLWPSLQKNTLDFMMPLPIAEHEPHPRHLKRLASTWQNDFKEKMASFALHQKPPHFEAMFDNTATITGIVTHRILQQLTVRGKTWWSSMSNNQQTHYLYAQLKQCGIALGKIGEAAHFIHRTIQTMLSDAKGQWILCPHTEQKSEYALTTLINDKIENLVIDRTFVDENYHRWIIDYKTSIPLNDKIEEFLQNEQKKYDEKMQKYAQAMRHLDQRPIKLGLYFPAIPAWVEWDVGI